MPVITRAELENAQRDVSDLGKVVNGAANLSNPSAVAPNNVGTVTTRQGQLIKTLSKVVADGFDSVQARLTPLIYNTTIERENAILVLTGTGVIQVGQTCFDIEDTNLYICVQQMVGPTLTRVWTQLSNVQDAARATLGEVYRESGEGANLTIDYHKIIEDRKKLLDNNALTVHHIEWPGKSTVNEGLAASLGYSSWPVNHHGQHRVHYGCRFEQIDLTDVSVGSAYPDWIAASNRFFIRNTAPNLLYKLYIPGYVDIISTWTKTVWIRDCIIDTNYFGFQGIAKSNMDIYPCYVEHCDIRRFLNEACGINYGHVVNCNIELSRGDGIKGAGHDLVIHGNMIRLLGQDLPSAHADGLQILDCSRLQITQNTFWMPGTDTYYSEGAYGTTQIIRLITEFSSNVLEDVVVAGNLLMGGGFTIGVRARVAGSKVENVIIANNIIGGTEAGEKIYLYGPITKDHWAVNNPGTIRNLIFWNNKMHDGTGFNTESGVAQGGTDQNGLWHYSKEHASPLFLEVGKRYGLLDWNGDPLVANRTTG